MTASSAARGLILAGLSLPVLAVAAGIATWRLTPITSVGWNGSSCAALDDRGHAVGSANLGGGEFGQAAFVFNGRRARTWGIVNTRDAAQAHGISSDGTVVGKRITDPVFGFHEPVAWSGGKPRTLPPLNFLDTSGEAVAVNVAGDIVGTSADANGYPHAVRWRGGKVKDLAPSSLRSAATAINAAGTIVGNVAGSMVRFENDGPVPLAGLEGVLGDALAIDDAGAVVGDRVDPSDKTRHAFIWKDGRASALEQPAGYQSSAWGMNNRGLVVGYILRRATFSAVAWQSGHMVRLDDALDPGTGAGWHVELASDANDKGQICATATRADDPYSSQAVLLTPMD